MKFQHKNDGADIQSGPGIHSKLKPKHDKLCADQGLEDVAAKQNKITSAMFARCVD